MAKRLFAIGNQSNEQLACRTRRWFWGNFLFSSNKITHVDAMAQAVRKLNTKKERKKNEKKTKKKDNSCKVEEVK